MWDITALTHPALTALTGTAGSAADGFGFLLGFAWGLGNGLAWAGEHINWIIGVGAVIGLIIGLREHIQKTRSRDRSDGMAADLAGIRRAVGVRSIAERPVDPALCTARLRTGELEDPR